MKLSRRGAQARQQVACCVQSGHFGSHSPPASQPVESRDLKQHSASPWCWLVREKANLLALDPTQRPRLATPPVGLLKWPPGHLAKLDLIYISWVPPQTGGQLDSFISAAARLGSSASGSALASQRDEIDLLRRGESLFDLLYSLASNQRISLSYLKPANFLGPPGRFHSSLE